MLNFELLNDLYLASGLSTQEFSDFVFGPNANRTINYFKDKESISTEKLKRLCELFHVSADKLLGMSDCRDYCHNNTIIGDNNKIGTVPDDPMLYIAYVKDYINTQKSTINLLERENQSLRDELQQQKINYKNILDMLKNSTGNRTKKNKNHQ